MHIKVVLGLLLTMTLIGAAPHVTHAERGSGSTGTNKVEDSAKGSTDDDGTPDQGKGDFDVNGNPSDDSDSILSDDDGTPDQGRGDFDAAGNPIDSRDDATIETKVESSESESSDDHDDSFFKGFRTWFSRLFSWWN